MFRDSKLPGVVQVKYLIFLFFSITAQAQVLNESEVSASLGKLEKLAPDKFINEIAPIREGLQQYMLTKKRVCQGEFTPRAISAGGIEQKLNEKEKLGCLQELKDFEGSFIEALYSSRKRFLEYNYTKQLEELQKVRENALKDLRKKH
jgi:hypothetical protein